MMEMDLFCGESLLFLLFEYEFECFELKSAWYRSPVENGVCAPHAHNVCPPRREKLARGVYFCALTHNKILIATIALYPQFLWFLSISLSFWPYR